MCGGKDHRASTLDVLAVPVPHFIVKSYQQPAMICTVVNHLWVFNVFSRGDTIGFGKAGMETLDGKAGIM